VIDITQSATENINRVAEAKGAKPRDLTVVVLDRPRHDDLVAEIRSTGARIHSISDGDVAGAIATAWPTSSVDILFGIGGTPEGVISAAAMKCMRGSQQGRLWPRNDDERAAAPRPGYDLDQVLTQDDMVRGDNCFFAATGISDGELLDGVQLLAGRRQDAVAGDALDLRYRAPRRDPSPSRPHARLKRRVGGDPSDHTGPAQRRSQW
jgi:fructose-1,6-bisphosphatase II